MAVAAAFKSPDAVTGGVTANAPPSRNGFKGVVAFVPEDVNAAAGAEFSDVEQMKEICSGGAPWFFRS